MRQSRCMRMLIGFSGCVAATQLVFAAPGCGAIDLGALVGEDACIYFNCDAFFLTGPTDEHDDMDGMDGMDDMDDMGGGEEHAH